MGALRSERDLYRHIRPIQSLPYPPIDLLPHRLIALASAVPRTRADERVQYRRLPGPAREGIATPLSLHRLIPQEHGTARDPENGATIETFDGVAGKVARRSVVDTEILADTAAETDEATAWIRAALPKSGAQ